jgi:hypothetical protein
LSKWEISRNAGAELLTNWNLEGNSALKILKPYSHFYKVADFFLLFNKFLIKPEIVATRDISIWLLSLLVLEFSPELEQVKIYRCLISLIFLS